jgi:Ca2+-binding EF-hand superfamily protein
MDSTTFSEASLQIIIDVFRTEYRTKKNAVNKNDLLLHLRGKGQANFSERTFRHIIAHIRNNDMIAPAFIVSNCNEGYWWRAPIKKKWKSSWIRS